MQPSYFAINVSCMSDGIHSGRPSAQNLFYKFTTVIQYMMLKTMNARGNITRETTSSIMALFLDNLFRLLSFGFSGIPLDGVLR